MVFLFHFIFILLHTYYKCIYYFSYTGLASGIVDVYDTKLNMWMGTEAITPRYALTATVTATGYPRNAIMFAV